MCWDLSQHCLTLSVLFKGTVQGDELKQYWAGSLPLRFPLSEAVPSVAGWRTAAAAGSRLKTVLGHFAAPYKLNAQCELHCLCHF